MFSCEFCEILKSKFFHITPQVAASGHKTLELYKVIVQVQLTTIKAEEYKNWVKALVPSLLCGNKTLAIEIK